MATLGSITLHFKAFVGLILPQSGFKTQALLNNKASARLENFFLREELFLLLERYATTVCGTYHRYIMRESRAIAT